MGVVNDLSPETSELIDSEIKRLLQESYNRAIAILKEHQQEHHMLAEALLKYETLDAEDVKTILISPKDNDQSMNHKLQQLKLSLNAPYDYHSCLLVMLP